VLRQPSRPEDLQAQFEAVRDANQATLADLERKGVTMDPLSFVHARIDNLIDFIAQTTGPNGGRWAAMARLQFEQHIAIELQNVEKQATKAQLAQAGQWTPEMIARLAAETGLFRSKGHGHL
jgi:hypothetical protein